MHLNVTFVQHEHLASITDDAKYVDLVLDSRDLRDLFLVQCVLDYEATLLEFHQHERVVEGVVEGHAAYELIFPVLLLCLDGLHCYLVLMVDFDYVCVASSCRVYLRKVS